MKLLKWIFIVILLYISVLDTNILYPPKPVNLGGGTMMYFKDNLKVVTNAGGDIITVIFQ